MMGGMVSRGRSRLCALVTVPRAPSVSLGWCRSVRQVNTVWLGLQCAQTAARGCMVPAWGCRQRAVAGSALRVVSGLWAGCHRRCVMAHAPQGTRVRWGPSTRQQSYVGSGSTVWQELVCVWTAQEGPSARVRGCPTPPALGPVRGATTACPPLCPPPRCPVPWAGTVYLPPAPAPCVHKARLVMPPA
jgi:hypothetical protein